MATEVENLNSIWYTPLLAFTENWPRSKLTGYKLDEGVWEYAYRKPKAPSRES